MIKSTWIIDKIMKHPKAISAKIENRAYNMEKVLFVRDINKKLHAINVFSDDGFDSNHYDSMIKTLDAV